MEYKILSTDKEILNYKQDILLRMENYEKKKQQLLAPGQTLSDFANGHSSI